MDGPTKEDGNCGRIFISYGHDEHFPFARRLKNDLQASGHEVWFDAERIKPGGDWERYIEDGLRWLSEGGMESRFILIMTPHSVRRPDGFCLNELAKAVAMNVRIIPIMLVQCEPPLSICRIQWLDMQDCVPLNKREARYKQKFRMLLDAIDRDLPDFEGFHALLLGTLKPLSFDADIRYKQDRFIGRSWVIEEIDRWLADKEAGRIFWITGSPGVGKTALSAWLCANRPDIIAYHFCRHDNIQNIDPRRCIMSLAYQLSTQLPIYEDRLRHIDLDEIKDLDARSLMDVLIIQPLSSSFPGPKSTLVILIDALDEASVNGKNELASFIAAGFDKAPEWLRLIATSRPEPDVMGPFQAFTPFNIDGSSWKNERDICEFLAREIGDMASPEVIKSIMKKCNGLFIYAEWVVRELKIKRLSLDRLEDFPQGLGGIYLKYFERQFPDIRAWESRVRPALEVLSAAQEPINVKMISEIFGWSSHDERAFKRSLGSLFIDEGGVIVPFHLSVMDWLTDEDKTDQYFVSIAEGHKALASYLMDKYRNGSLALPHPMMKYLPMHLCKASLWKDLERIMNDLTFMRFGWEEDKFNILKVFTLMEECSRLRLIEVYRPIIESPGSYESVDLMTVVGILTRRFHFDEALSLLDYLTEHYRKVNDIKGMMASINIQTGILITRCDYDRSTALLKEQERICRDTGDDNGLQNSLLKEAEILWRKNEFEEALILLCEQENICRKIGNLDGLQESLNYQALIMRVKGRMDDAIVFLREQEQLCRQTGNLTGLMDAMTDRSLILRAVGDLDGSIALLKEVESLSRKIGDKEALRSSLSAQGIILLWRGDFDAAMALYREDEKICRGFGYRYGLWESMCYQAMILRIKGSLDAAMGLLDEALKICEDTNNKWGRQFCLGQQAIALRLGGDLDGALSLHREEERICREIGHKRDLSMSISNQAVILYLKGDLDGALALYIEAEKKLREISYKYGLQVCLGEKAITLYAKGDTDAALACLKEQERICLEMKLKPDLDRCLARQKDIAQDQLKLEKEGREVKARATIK